MNTEEEVGLNIGNAGGANACNIVAWNCCGSMLAAIFRRHKGVVLISAKTWEVASKVTYESSITLSLTAPLVWHPRDDAFIVASKSEERNIALVCDVEGTHEMLRLEPFRRGTIVGICWSSGGTRLLFLSAQCEVTIVDVATKHLVARWDRTRVDSLRTDPEDAEDDVTAWCLDCNSNGSMMAVGYDDGVVEFYDMRPAVVVWPQVRLLAIAIRKPNAFCAVCKVPQGTLKYFIDTVAAYLSA